MADIKKRKIAKIILVVAIFFFGALAGYFYNQKVKSVLPSTSIPKNKYLAFTTEVYDKIQENYWDKIDEEQLTNLFVLGIEKLTGQPQNLKTNNKANLEKLLTSIINQTEDEEKKKEFVTQLADVVLANLKPFNRSRLYTQKEEKTLSDNVKNISGTDHYQVLGLNKDASQEELKKAHEEKTKELDLEKDKSPEAEQKLAQINQAYEVLKNQETKKIYDSTGVEPTIASKLIQPNIFYLHLKKMSPTTLEDLKRVTEEVNNQEGLNTLIFDLRDNIGGAIDGLPYFLGPFIGANQYAYQFFHQGETTDFKTKIGWLPSLVRYKKVVVLVNEGTQSSAEVMAATLKKYNVGVVVGTTTKGWGTVEKVFQLEAQLDPSEKYSVFLAHSLTLRDDGEPIEGNGVQPTIDFKNPNWEKELYAYFHYPELTEAVKEVLKLAEVNEGI